MTFTEVVNVMGYEQSMQGISTLQDLHDVVMKDEDGIDGGLLSEMSCRIVSCNAEVTNYRDFLAGMDFPDLMTILKAWIRAVTGGDRPLTETEQMDREEELGLT